MERYKKCYQEDNFGPAGSGRSHGGSACRHFPCAMEKVGTKGVIKAGNGLSEVLKSSRDFCSLRRFSDRFNASYHAGPQGNFVIHWAANRRWPESAFALE